MAPSKSASQGSTVAGSALFAGFRGLGLYSSHLAHVLRYHRRHREFYLVTAVGRSFHTYNVSSLPLLARLCELPFRKFCALLFYSDTSILYSALFLEYSSENVFIMKTFGTLNFFFIIILFLKTPA